MMKKLIIAALVCMALASVFTGCSGESASSAASDVSSAVSDAASNVNVALKDIRDSVKNLFGDNYIPNQELTKDDISERYGLKDDMYEDVIAEIPMISTNVDTFIAVKAKEGKAEEVEAALNKYRESLVADTAQYPTNKVKIQASKVVRQGDYVFYLLLGSIPAEVEEKGDEAVLAEAQKQIQSAEDEIAKLF